jgi:hypothetical protein
MSAVEDRLLALATCLCAEIADHPVTPPVCFCGVLPGEEVAYDWAGDCETACGMAWVRLVTAYPSTVIGEATGTPGNCGSMIGMDVEVGIMRCIPGMDDAGNPPSSDDLLAASLWQWEDMTTMRRAILCCTGSKDFLLGAYVPIGPQGGLVGGAWTVSMHEV